MGGDHAHRQTFTTERSRDLFPAIDSPAIYSQRHAGTTISRVRGAANDTRAQRDAAKRASTRGETMQRDTMRRDAAKRASTLGETTRRDTGR